MLLRRLRIVRGRSIERCRARIFRGLVIRIGFQQTVESIFQTLLRPRRPLVLGRQASPSQPVLRPPRIVLDARPQLIQCSWQEARADFMQRLPKYCDALFGAIGACYDSVSLMELEPAIEERLLIWNLRDTCLRDFKWRLGSGEAIGPKLYKLLVVDFKSLETLTFTEPAVPLPTCSSLHKSNTVNVYSVGQTVSPLISTSTAIRCGSQSTGCGELVIAMRVQARAISSQRAHLRNIFENRRKRFVKGPKRCVARIGTRPRWRS